jgi:hypothetical protein
MEKNTLANGLEKNLTTAKGQALLRMKMEKMFFGIIQKCARPFRVPVF